MKYKVRGNMYFEGTVDIKDESKTVEEFNKYHFDTDRKGLAEHIVISYVAKGMDFVEGVGTQGEDFVVDDEFTEFEDCQAEVITNEGEK